MTDDIGDWWQGEGMFSVKQGMHTVYQKPTYDDLKKFGLTESEIADQKAFYDEMMNMARGSFHFLFVETRPDTQATDAATVGQGPPKYLLAFFRAIKMF